MAWSLSISSIKTLSNSHNANTSNVRDFKSHSRWQHAGRGIGGSRQDRDSSTIATRVHGIYITEVAPAWLAGLISQIRTQLGVVIASILCCTVASGTALLAWASVVDRAQEVTWVAGGIFCIVAGVTTLLQWLATQEVSGLVACCLSNYVSLRKSVVDSGDSLLTVELSYVAFPHFISACAMTLAYSPEAKVSVTREVYIMVLRMIESRIIGPDECL